MMQIATEGIDRICPEIEVIDECLDLDGKRIIELGCGRADITRIIATGGANRQVVALEVDQVQHAINARITDLPNVAFRLAGAEAIPEPDASADVVFMFKSPHQVPRELFFLAPVHFNSFAAFESAVIGVSHTQHRLSPELYEQVRERFSRHLGPDGADFLQPVRVDLLRKGR